MASSARSRQLNSPYALFSNIYERVTEWDDFYDETTEDPATQEAWRKRMANRIQTTVLTANEFPLYADGSGHDNRTSRTNMEKIALRFLTFYSVITIAALRLHSGGLFGSAKGLIAEFTSGLGQGAGSSSNAAAIKRGSFDLKK